MRGTERGTVLISVLWIVLTLSLVAFSLASTVRGEVRATHDDFDSERAFFMAKGAAEVVYHTLLKNTPIPEDSPIRQEKGEYIFPFESGEARVHIDSGADLIDLNAASDKTLASVFNSIGVDRETRNRLVDSILDWRDKDDIPHLYGAEADDYPGNTGERRAFPRNGDFQSVNELLFLEGMTPSIFYGFLSVDPATLQYRRIPGIRDLVTILSGTETVDPNLASYDVLLALPAMIPAAAKRMVTERTEKLFTGVEDLIARVPELAQSPSLGYLSFRPFRPVALVSRATILASGVSRTVRLIFRPQGSLQILSVSPLIYRITNDVVSDRWRFE